jgi:hypothetical protein
LGWYFRRSLGFGPFRVNLSRSGVGWSLGGRGFRKGVDARGRRTTHVSIPGTGIGYRKVGARGCVFALAVASLIGGGVASIAAATAAASLIALLP